MPLFTTHPSSTANRFPSPAIWDKVPDDVKLNQRGWHFYEEFDDKALMTSRYTVTQAGSVGTIAMTDQDGGAAVLNSGDTTAGHGVNVQLGAGEMVHTLGGDTAVGLEHGFAMEFYLKLATITSGLQAFLGACTTDTTIYGSNVISVDDILGFRMLSTTVGLCELYCDKTGASAEGTKTTTTIVTGTWTKIGLLLYRGTIYHFLDGVQLATTLDAATYLPITEIRPSYVMQSNGTAQPTMTLGFARYAQWNGSAL